MTRRHRSRRALEPGDLVAIGAAVSGIGTDAIVAGSDVDLLVLAAAAARDEPTLAGAAAGLLVPIASGRPFPCDNGAIAWAAAAHLATVNGHRVRMSTAAATDLVRDVAAGAIDEPAVAAALADAIIGRPGPVARVLGWLGSPVREVPALAAWACPLCDHPVLVAPGRTSVFTTRPSARDLVVDCARVRRIHDTDGVPVGACPATGDHDLDRRIALLRAARTIDSAVPERV